MNIINYFTIDKVIWHMNHKNLRNTLIGAGSLENIQRYGEGGAEFLKALRGIDYETGKIFDRSLKKISEGKLNPNYVEQNIKQQAGFSAEVASVARKNSKAIIDRDTKRYIRSEDYTGYGKNHNAVDILEIDGPIIKTESQQKFVTDTDALLKKIAKGDTSGGKNDLSRYMAVDKLDVPTEQVELMKQTCRDESKKLAEQAQRAQKDGNAELSKKLQKQSDNYKQLEEKISDSGLTTEEAIAYRKNPELRIAKDILNTSHQAGIAGAQLGAAIGGGVSIITNIFAIASGDKELGDAAADIAKDTLVSAGVGYGTSFTGAAMKTYMQQSANTSMRTLSKTGLPAMVVSTCLAMKSSIIKFAKGEISSTGLLQEMTVTSSGLMSSSMFTIAGQIAIPIPVLGGLIGGLIGYTLTNTFYQSFFSVLNDAKLAKERRQIVEMQCEASIAIANQYKAAIDELFEHKIKQLDQSSKRVFYILDSVNVTPDEFCEQLNQFAELLGKKLTINNMAELEEVMLSDDKLII